MTRDQAIKSMQTGQTVTHHTLRGAYRLLHNTLVSHLLVYDTETWIPVKNAYTFLFSEKFNDGWEIVNSKKVQPYLRTFRNYDCYCELCEKKG
jgi:hypothetical protein